MSQKAAAPIGAAFTLVCLVTGSLWGKPMWGTYWVWDARLTSVLVLFLMYCGILALWRTIEDPGRAARAVSILTLVGVVNIPIIKFSVDWWFTLHQGPSVLRMGGPTIHASILMPASRHGARPSRCSASTLHLAGMRTEILRRRVRRLALLEAERLDGPSAPCRPDGRGLGLMPDYAFYIWSAYGAAGLADRRARAADRCSITGRRRRRSPASKPPKGARPRG